MNQKEKFDTCLEQAKFAFQMHNARRAWEWRLTLGYWALIIASMVQGIQIPLWAWVIFTVFYIFFWVAPTWAANENNKIWYNHFMLSAAKVLENDSYEVKIAPPPVKGLKRIFGCLHPR